MVTISGLVATVAAWAWLLSDGCSVPILVAGCLITAVLILAGSSWTVLVVRSASLLDPPGFGKGLSVVAFVAVLLGLEVLFFQHLYGRYRPPTFVDRRFAALFLGIAAYSAMVPLISRSWLLRNVSNHSPGPTLASGTSPAGQESRHR